MIVRDKEATIKKANDIASILIKRLTKEAKTFECDDDPAEYLYLACHTLGNLIFRMSIILSGYGEIYGINQLASTTVFEWIKLIAEENLKQNI